MQTPISQPPKEEELAVSSLCSEQNSLVSPHLRTFKAYQPGRPTDEIRKELGIDRFINLASNENPLGVSPAVKTAIIEAVPDVFRYPEASALLLRQALADKHGIKIANLAVGNGSESIMSCIIRAFLHGNDEALTSAATFVDFSLKVQANGTRLVQVPHNDYHFDLPAIARAVNDRTKLIYLCNPNNPTGTTFTKAEFDEFIGRIPERVLVVLDEAYREFAVDSPDFPDSMSYRYDNLLTLRTFSKAYGMAGIRLGYGIAHEYLINFINKVRLVFEPNSLALAAGLAALHDHEFLERTLTNNRAGIQFFERAFSELGLRALPSQSNFIMLDLETPERVEHLYANLLRRGIAIRPLAGFGLPHCIRVTTGTADENEQLVEAMQQILKGC